MQLRMYRTQKSKRWLLNQFTPFVLLQKMSNKNLNHHNKSSFIILLSNPKIFRTQKARHLLIHTKWSCKLRSNQQKLFKETVHSSAKEKFLRKTIVLLIKTNSWVKRRIKSPTSMLLSQLVLFSSKISSTSISSRSSLPKNPTYTKIQWNTKAKRQNLSQRRRK